MQRLLAIGFQKVGVWKLSNGNLALEISSPTIQENVLYAFIDHDRVLYVGKTTKTLTKRMMGYKNPGPTQYTNIKNNANIKALLQQTECIDIYALEDRGLMCYGEFQINLAAGLEDDLIKVFQPEWNCR